MAGIIRYEHVDISYNGHKAVNDISFSVNEGEILGIAGESGSGKSTLIKAAMGLLGNEGMVTRGDIYYDGKDLPDLSDKERRKINGPEIGMIFQSAGASFCPIRKIGKQLYESVSEHTVISWQGFLDSVRDVFESIGLDDCGRILDSYPFELSGGMQQRVGIAAAMLLSPKILLADEPTSALDAAVQKKVVDTLLRVRETYGTTILIVTHNIGVLGAMADNVLIMKDGRMVEYGSRDDILNHPEEDYTRKLMEAVIHLKRYDDQSSRDER